MLFGLSTQDKKRIKPLIIVAVAVVAAWLLWSPYGLKQVVQTHGELKRVSAANQTLRAKNAALEAEIKKLQSDQKYIEEVARKRHGMMKKNEMIFEFQGDNK